MMRDILDILIDASPDIQYSIRLMKEPMQTKEMYTILEELIGAAFYDADDLDVSFSPSVSHRERQILSSPKKKPRVQLKF